ncbi:MAG: DUF1254 domain-containing protein, partial [Pseudomonadota bacterium]
RWICMCVCVAGLTACATDQDAPTIRDAALYAYGPYQYALNVERMLQRNQAAGVDINEIAYLTDLADHRSRSVTAPNADTIYGSAVLDLSAGPVALTVPDAGERYLSVMLMDIFSDIITTVGTRRTGESAGHYWIVGPDWAGPVPDEISLIRSPGQDVWLLARVFVAGPDDLEAARALQSQIIVRSVSDAPTPQRATLPGSDDQAHDALIRVNHLLGRAPNHPHTGRAAQFETFGLRPGNTDAWADLGPLKRQAWRMALDRMPGALQAALAERANAPGWRPAPRNLSRYGTDDATRAAVSLIGFGALQIEDASYFSSSTDAQDRPLNGAYDYQLTLQPDAVPVDAFWSLSVYGVEADGRRFFIDNPINRHAINSATPGLVLDDEGMLTLQLSPDAPPSTANWLPTPEGDFALIFRTYLPGEPILSGNWTPPALIRDIASGAE